MLHLSSRNRLWKVGRQGPVFRINPLFVNDLASVAMTDLVPLFAFTQNSGLPDSVSQKRSETFFWGNDLPEDGMSLYSR